MEQLKTATDGRLTCKCHGRKIKKGQKFLDFYCLGFRHSRSFRVCDVCIYRLSKQIDRKAVNKRMREIVLEAI